MDYARSARADRRSPSSPNRLRDAMCSQGLERTSRCAPSRARRPRRPQEGRRSGQSESLQCSVALGEPPFDARAEISDAERAARLPEGGDEERELRPRRHADLEGRWNQERMAAIGNAITLDAALDLQISRRHRSGVRRHTRPLRLHRARI